MMKIYNGVVGVCVVEVVVALMMILLMKCGNRTTPRRDDTPFPCVTYSRSVNSEEFEQL